MCGDINCTEVYIITIFLIFQMTGLEIKMEKELKKCTAGFIVTDIVRRSWSISSAIYRDDFLCSWNSAMDEV